MIYEDQCGSHHTYHLIAYEFLKGLHVGYGPHDRHLPELQTLYVELLNCLVLTPNITSLLDSHFLFILYVNI
jgi:hypothetical protein